MKTAMQELLYKVNKMASNNIEVVKIYIKEGIEKEKQQIVDSYKAGDTDFNLESEGEDYYNKTFTNQ